MSTQTADTLKERLKRMRFRRSLGRQDQYALVEFSETMVDALERVFKRIDRLEERVEALEQAQPPL